ncbi:glycoside hydrolase family protein [Microcoleus sp. herbarium14]|uniref:glycoside hydrolase family protein n=1 Tax=Microcoleus sp. herbarium14 TaxID=3055439 RepID=UPI002FD288BF
MKNLAGVVTYDNTQVNNRIAKYGIEVNESGKFRINLNSPNGKMELSVNKFIGSEDRPVQLSGLGFSANSDGWLELDLNKGRYDIEVKTPSNYWQEPDWNSTQQRLVRPYTLNATFTPNAPQPGQGKVPASAGAFDKTVVSSGVVNHYYKNGYLTVQPSGQASWYGYPSLVISGSAQVINEPVPLTDPDGNYSIQTAQNLFLISGGADLGDGVNKDQVSSGRILSSIGGKDLNDFYKFSLNSSKLVNLELSQLGSGAEWSLIKDRNGNGQVDPGEVIKLGNIVTESQSLDLILGAGNYYLQIGSAAPNAASQYVVNVVATPPENEVISSYNSDYFLVQNGQRRLVPDRETLNGLGINPNTVKRFSNEDLALIPPGQPMSPLIPQWQKSIDDAANQNSLGNPVTSYWDAADSPTGTKGYGRTYDRGSVYWTAKSGAIALVGSFADAYHSNENNGSKGWLGFPTAKQWNWEGGQRIDFEGGYIYRTAKEGIRAFKYDESPWQKSIDAEYARYQDSLGSPKGGYWDAADSPTGTKGHGQNYNNGHVFWTAKYGAIAVPGQFANTYNQTGGSNSWLGFPTKGKETDSSGGQRIDFEGGYIYWTEKEGAKAYHPWETPQQNLNNTVGYDGTKTHQTYVNTFNNKGSSSALGSPTGNVHPAGTENGYIQEFSGGSEGSGAIMKSGANDNSYWVGGDFWAKYLETGGVTGVLGYPTSDRYQFNSGWKQDFQGGSLSTPNSGTNTSNGSGQVRPETLALIEKYDRVYSNNPPQQGHTGDVFTGTNYLSLNGSPEFSEMWGKLFQTTTQPNSDGGYLDHYAYIGPNSVHNNTYHAGIDFGVPSGTPVKALVGGEVVYVGTGDGKKTSSSNPMYSTEWGTIAIYNATLKQTFMYLHMGTSQFSEGDTIQAGTVIGTSGSTGAASQHLHLEVKPTPSKPNGSTVKGLLPQERKNWQIVEELTDNPLTAYLAARDKGLTEGGGTVVNPPSGNSGNNSFIGNHVVSDAGLDFLIQHEGGVQLSLYDNDGGGNCTIGVGHLVHKGMCNGSESQEFKQGITQERAREIFKADISKFSQVVNNYVKVPLNQNQFDALVSFAFNVGEGYKNETGEEGFIGSQLLIELNAGNYDKVPTEMNRWVNANGNVVQGLKNRRTDEGLLFSQGRYG